MPFRLDTIGSFGAADGCHAGVGHASGIGPMQIFVIGLHVNAIGIEFGLHIELATIHGEGREAIDSRRTFDRPDCETAVAHIHSSGRFGISCREEGICYSMTLQRDIAMIHRKRAIRTYIHASCSGIGVGCGILGGVGTLDGDVFDLQTTFRAIDGIDRAVALSGHTDSSIRTRREDTQGERVDRQGEESVGSEAIAEGISVEVDGEVGLNRLYGSFAFERDIVQQG